MTHWFVSKVMSRLGLHQTVPASAKADKRETTLRKQLVLLAVAGLVPLFVLALIGAVLTAADAVDQATENLEFSASLLATNQAQIADSARQVLTTIASTPGIVEGTTANCRSYFKALTAQIPSYANLGIIGADGYIRCDSRSVTPGGFAGDRPYFSQALAQRGFVVGGFMLSRLDNVPLITFALPVLNDGGSVTAVAFASIFLSELSMNVSGVRLPGGGRVVIADQNGLVLVESPENLAGLGKPLSSPALQQAFKTRVAGITKGSDANKVEQIYAFSPTGKQAEASFFVAVSADFNDILAPSRQRLLLVFLALTLVALLGSWIAWVSGGRMIARPAARILQAASQMQEGRLDVRIPLHEIGKSSEFTRIAEGFNRMADALERREGELAAELARTIQTKRKLLDAQRLGRIGHWEINMQTQQLSWSQELHELFGVTPETFDGRYESFLQMIHPEDRDGYTQRRENAIENNESLDVEFRIVTPKGDVRWIHQRGKRGDSSLADSGQADNAGFRAGVVQDINERKQAELALERSNSMLQRTGRVAQIGGWEVNIETLETQWSEELYRIYDIEPTQMLSARQALDFYPPDARKALHKAMRAAIESAIPWDIELPFITAKGRHIRVRTQGQPVQKNGKVVSLSGALQDITVQHASREHLRLLETSVARLNDVVVITEVNPSGEPGLRIVFVNDAFERLMGYTREEVLGKSPRFLRGPNTQRSALERIKQAMQRWQPSREELINYKKNGEEIWLDIDTVPIANASGRFTHWVAVERDITDRKRAEQALMDSDQRYFALFATAPVPMWVFDGETRRFLTVNETAVQHYGYSIKEFLAMTLFDIRSSNEHNLLNNQLHEIDMSQKTTWQHRRKDGSTLWVDVVSKPIKYAGREARFVVVQDISAQRKAETEVREHLFTLQRAADAAQAITWHQTLEGTMREVAEQARGVIGAHFALVSMEDSHDGLHPIVVRSLSEKYSRQSGPPEFGDALALYREVGDNRRSLRLTQTDMAAQLKWVSDRGGRGEAQVAMGGLLAIPLTGRSGKKIGLLQLLDKYEGDFSLQDEYVAVELAQLASTAMENAQLLEEVNQLNAGLEQKVNERTAALTRQEALFRALADQAPQVVWTADPKGLVTYVNRAWLDLVGGKARDWLGVRAFAVIHPQDLPETTSGWKAAVAGRSNFVGLRRVLDKVGTYHTMSYRASPVFDEAGAISFWVGIDADISEMKTIETALRLSNQELEAFSYSVSHDLRSPLNTIDGFSRLLSKQMTSEANPKALHYLSRIQAGAAQMGQLIEDMLSMAQVSRMQLRHELVDLSALALQIFDDWQARDPHRKVKPQIEPGLHVHGDSRLIKVVMENLLGNAWKFTSNEQDAEISVGHFLNDVGSTVFFVRDNGAGFDMAYADKLFTAFQRLHSPTEFSGTGVGLATVSRVISRHSGQIWADAAPGKGATFFFTVPQMATSA